MARAALRALDGRTADTDCRFASGTIGGPFTLRLRRDGRKPLGGEVNLWRASETNRVAVVQPPYAGPNWHAVDADRCVRRNQEQPSIAPCRSPAHHGNATDSTGPRRMVSQRHSLTTQRDRSPTLFTRIVLTSIPIWHPT